MVVYDGSLLTGIPETVLDTYYQLCSSQGSYLHHNLLIGMNPDLVIAMLSQTHSIVKSIRDSNLSTASLDIFTAYYKTLDAFDSMGFEIGFVQRRIQQLMNICAEEFRILLIGWIWRQIIILLD